MGDFPAPATVQGQEASRAAWRELQMPGPKPAWWQDFQAIRSEFPHFKNWRIWVYIAWIGQPREARQPATIEEFAPQVLGCSSRVVRKWHKRQWGDAPGIDEAIVWATKAALLSGRRDYYDTLDFMAKQRDAKNFNYLRLALELLGDYRPNGDGKKDDREQAQMENWLNELRQAA